MNHLTGFALVALGGALGAAARYGVGLAVASLRWSAFPWATVAVNISGSFLLGLLAALLTNRSSASPEALRLFFGVGFLGAYTTFSTYEMDNHILFGQGRWGLALLNMAGSVAAGFLALRLGTAAGR